MYIYIKGIYCYFVSGFFIIIVIFILFGVCVVYGKGVVWYLYYFQFDFVFCGFVGWRWVFLFCFYFSFFWVVVIDIWYVVFIGIGVVVQGFGFGCFWVVVEGVGDVIVVVVGFRNVCVFFCGLLYSIGCQFYWVGFCICNLNLEIINWAIFVYYLCLLVGRGSVF